MLAGSFGYLRFREKFVFSVNLYRKMQNDQGLGWVKCEELRGLLMLFGAQVVA